MSKPITLLYFAWLRERIGLAHEEIVLPDDVDTVEALIGYLRARGPRYAEALRPHETIRCAINQDFVEAGSRIHANDEVAFFPPVTGG
ncbi:molybdopterin converting factor subunit 1 [Rhodopila globiformis]|uniref:Molybdopterin synthase sulfur carrier subunit n=1 Tax=Rhodopila globiformis TaxID=1071 RepID=A0A2S6NBH7_RHOGL|nr:molybdopterin converting factor subunit 1 [Rhodopila globiformis]PPQ31982.1 molybdopterin converting factor subunit 1 [Rhodopila globiformis]